MTLNASGPLSMGGSTVGQSINLELGVSATAQGALNDTSFRTLAGVASGQISISNFYGKSSATYFMAYCSVDSSPLATDTSNNIYVGGSGSGSVPYLGKINASNQAFSYFYSYSLQDAGNNYALEYEPSTASVWQGGYKRLTYSFAASTGVPAYEVNIGNVAGSRKNIVIGIGADGSGNVFTGGNESFYFACCCLGVYPTAAKINSAGNVIYQYRDQYSLNYYTHYIYGFGNNSTRVGMGGMINFSGYKASLYVFNQNITLLYKACFVLESNTYNTVYGIVFNSSNQPVIWAGGSSTTYYLFAWNDSASTFPFTAKIAASGAVTGITGGNNMAVDSSGNYYVAARINGTWSGYGRLVLIKFNSSGVVQWRRKLYTSAISLSTVNRCITINSAGQLVVLVTRTGGSGGCLILQLPSDGSKTGTYTVNGISYTYDAETDLAISSGISITKSTFSSSDDTVLRGTSSGSSNTKSTITPTYSVTVI